MILFSFSPNIVSFFAICSVKQSQINVADRTLTFLQQPIMLARVTIRIFLFKIFDDL